MVDYRSGGGVVCREESQYVSYEIDKRLQEDSNQGTRWLGYDTRETLERSLVYDRQLSGLFMDSNTNTMSK